MARQKRKEDIEKGLQFIQSTIPFHGSQDEYKKFLQQLVVNLFAEGNDTFREGKFKIALGQYTEGLTVAEYAASEGLCISQELVCKLYVNRSCCYFLMGLFDKSLEDSEQALILDKDNLRALFRKAKALNMLERHQDAYSCISHRLLVLAQDESVTLLAQELVQKLGLKQRKAYKRPQQELETLGIISNGTSEANQVSSNSLKSVDLIYTELPPDIQLYPSNIESDGLDDGLQLPVSQPSTELTQAATILNDCDIIGDDVDSLLDSEMLQQQQVSLLTGQMPQLIPGFPTVTPLLPGISSVALPAPSPLPPASFGLLDSRKSVAPAVTPAYNIKILIPSESHLDTLDSFEESQKILDCLDSFSNDTKPLETSVLKGNKNHKTVVNTSNHLLPHNVDPAMQKESLLVLPNPLTQSYDFKQGCQQCYAKTGPKALDFTYKEKLEHKCKKDLLLARKKSSEKPPWLKIRPRPTKVNFSGPYVLCKDIQTRKDCKYGDNCTFAYYQAEIDVWNEERKGNLLRDQLFKANVDAKSASIARLLDDHKGIFIFLCQACFDSKPPIINQKNSVHPDFCTSSTSQHRFSDHKCLVHIFNSSTVRYSKIRQLQPRFQMDVCRHELRYGCIQEDACNFAHSHVELYVWMLQRQSGISHEAIVEESERMWKTSEPKTKQVAAPKSLDMKMKFVCSLCLRNGREIEADRDGKYCMAKARHSWTKDKRVLLVMSKAKKKWVPVRPLPSTRGFPQQYEICVHVQNGKKCQYIGNCSFAHSTEEKDIWTFMKDNKVLDLQLVYELSDKNTTTSEKTLPGAMGSLKEPEKQILMPTDYADLMAGFHCYLCGKNSNSEKQWQKHIQSEKHKERLFTVEKEESTWNFRFPAGEFKLCERYEETKSCPNEANCPFAHGQEELEEWLERRELLQQKVTKARNDMLLEQSDSDFGKYTFLLKDVA